MKAIKMRIQKHTQWAALLLAAVVAILTCVTVANATQTITTPNAVRIAYNLAGGANSAAITPATNTPVLVMGCNTSTNPSAGAQVSLLHIPSSGMTWAGLEGRGESATTTTITAGGGSIAGTHIVYIDAHHLVDIQVASADTIKIHNGNSPTQVGSVTLIW
jgi:hypothetical protein